jgi:prepilin-type processing-associated H-X9-DG protein
MTLYTNEHNFQLPGPLWRGQSPVYQIGPEGGFDISKGNLAAFLGPYLRFEPLAPGGEAVAKVLTCPAWRSAAPESQDLCYYSAGEFQQEESMLFPFGRSGGDPIDPMRITAIANPATTPAFWEFDKDLTGGIGFYYTEPRVPAEPVHEKFRNVLYFDGHVSAKAVGLPLF